MAEKVSDKPKFPAKPLRLLIVEDQAADAELCLRELRKGGLDVRGDVVSTAKEFIARLGTGDYDIILADDALPGWSGLDALQSLRNLQKDIPFLIVTGELGDETVAELVRVGVADYILKDRMARLPLAVRQALEEKKLREKNRKIEATSSNPVRILYVEDSRADAELSLHILKKAGFEIRADIVETREEFTARLKANTYDVVISDQHLSTWTGIEVFEHSRALGLDIPVILVTGTLNYAMAAQFAKRGLTDYVLKDRLARLPLVLRRALEQKALREERDRAHESILQLAAIVESSDDAIIGKTLDGTITSWNAGAERIYGYSANEALGRSISILVPPDRAEEIPQILEKLKRGEHVRNYETVWVRKDGKRIDTSVTTSLVKDSSGKLTGVSIIGRDITERKRAEEALIKLRKAVDTSGEVIFMTDREGVITFVNPEFTRLYGYTEQEVVGKTTPRVLKSGSRSPEEYASFWKTILDKRVGKEEWVNKTKDGRLVNIENATNPILDEQGDITGFLAIQRDITERKVLEGQLRQAQKMEAVGRLAGGIAHDFNNLLTIIAGYSDMMLSRLAADDPLRAHVSEIRIAGDRAASLTRQLLAFSRQQVLAPQVLDLNAVVANMDKMLRRLIGEHIDLVTVCEKRLWHVKADPGQLEQVIMNLAVNARDAMPKGGKLTLETANVELDGAYARAHVAVKPGRYIMLAVSDTGCGMDSETQSHLFEPFFTTKERGKGTGLGLSTVYGIVKQSGGNVWVYSELGRGATFKVYLPQVDEPLEEPRPVEARAVPARATETVLVVEDEVSVRSLVRGVLESRGYRVLEACHGADALSISDQHGGPIHLLLTDVVMPEMSGRDLASRVMPRRPEIRVLYMSGYTDDAIIHNGVLDAGTAFLQKPFTPDALARKVREVLDG